MYWEQFQLPGWLRRQHPLVLGRNCSTVGYYWRAREVAGHRESELCLVR